MGVRKRRAMAAALGLWAASPPAAADPPPAYALVVGSNQAGAGQQPLRFADDDAARVAEVLVELGGVDPGHVETLVDPGAEEVLGAIDDLAQRISEHRERGERVLATFYYSGHARARALALGGDELSLDLLRERLGALGASLTVVILDACQSGAMSRVKGIEAAPDFSSNSIQGLQTEGIAVLASSSATELSQEDDGLGGSTFTHHLVTGLRGAADRQGDGVVTLDEAYDYAYNRTLYATAQTAVGRQHPTLETELRGQGAAVLTRPAEASARLALPRELVAEILLEHTDSGTVVAEIHKAADGPMRLALPPGGYDAILRQSDGEIARCALVVAPDAETELAGSGCEPVEPGQPASKGARGPVPEAKHILELSAGALYGHDSDFVRRLDDFGYREDFPLFGDALPSGSISVVYNARRHLAGVLTWGSLDARSFRALEIDPYGATAETVYQWRSTRLGLYARARQPFARDAFVLYAQAGGGAARTTDSYDGISRGPLRYHLAAAAGLDWMPAFGRYRGFGLFGQIESVYAPTLKNLLGEVHDVGGTMWQLGLRVGF